MSTRPISLSDSYSDIPLPSGWTSVEPLEKGWSNERKFIIAAADDKRYLLRVRDGCQADNHRQEFEFLQTLYGRGVRVPKPYTFGLTNRGESSYMLLDWVEGTDLEGILPLLPPDEQIRLGLEAGCMLKAIHMTPISPNMPMAKSAKARSLSKIERFKGSGLYVEDSGRLIAFILQNIDCLDRDQPVCQHGDFHPGNLIYTPQGDIIAIDFNRWAVGDPAEEFYKLQSFTIESSVPFACGQLDGYFDGSVPQTFWKTLAVHVAVSSLYSILWAMPFGQTEMEGMLRRCERAVRDYQGFERTVPAWYKSTIRQIS